ncbi:ATPase [Chromatiales bacterium (ex Bugula neritina AB1)]|nr:ATPase [Chromatiales bacterium (ex Bugula neritina AB1)]
MEVAVLSDEQVLQSVGIYRYHHPLENAVDYKSRLAQISVAKSSMVKAGTAIEASEHFMYDNSLARGKKMCKDLGTLMLLAYNSQADSCIKSLRAGNVVTAKKRVNKTKNKISKLGSMMEMHVSEAYHALQIDELELTADYLVKKQEEKEAAREERERLREEKRAEAELAARRVKLEKERCHLINALQSLEQAGEIDEGLQEKLREIDIAIEENDYRIANVRAGYVYVISNKGAFGDGVVKIGLTRRLDPMDRVIELGAASVPFRFDVHCLYFSEDAVQLESELHQHFANRRLNHANVRKEFFFTSPQEVREVLVSKVGNLLEYNDQIESTEYFQSVGSWPETRTA